MSGTWRRQGGGRLGLDFEKDPGGFAGSVVFRGRRGAKHEDLVAMSFYRQCQRHLHPRPHPGANSQLPDQSWTSSEKVAFH